MADEQYFDNRAESFMNAVDSDDRDAAARVAAQVYMEDSDRAMELIDAVNRRTN